jgi:eukaryotic-like serine/threonine-protein kinase
MTSASGRASGVRTGDHVSGRVLDKYQILEEVGQGGMAVVYRALDTALKRTVAIKILHAHLASDEEAKRRFEREARAVAKLRHENILEIYDYSGGGSADSYIVTEFIEGPTLKQFVAAHPIPFPEIGAMIVAEVCRALAHAHGLGVLHRDIKPENIMIRDDGIVKLTDFGIAQIVDAQRMTVTGQLLGSPAYMSPEHVEGQPLDFRTDVFSTGILLYQVATGELPFKGRNPHEILKKIAECRYIDARVVNPLVGGRLGRIIDRAMARAPGDRYQGITPLLDELTAFLGEADLTDTRAELKRYFADAEAYAAELRPRLIAALTRRGKEELAARRVGPALELFNRVLTIDPGHGEVLREVERLSNRRRLARGLLAGGALALIAGGVTAAIVLLPPGRTAGAHAIDAAPLAVSDAAVLASMAPDAADLVDLPIDAGPTPTGDAAPAARRDAGHPVRRHDAAPYAIGADRSFRMVVRPQGASYAVDGGPFVQITRGEVVLSLGPGAHKIALRHPRCIDETVTIAADQPGYDLIKHLRFRPTRLIPVCARASAISVNNVRAVVSGTPVEITDFENGSRVVTVDFLIGDQAVSRTVTVNAGAPPIEVSCDAP